MTLFSCSRQNAATSAAESSATLTPKTSVSEGELSPALPQLGVPVIPGARRRDPEAAPAQPIRAQGIVPIRSVYFNVIAHADDWELFMNPEVYNEVLTESTKNVFIYLTAGDGGSGNGPVGQPYFISREDGARRATRFVANITPGTSEAETRQRVKVAGHVINKVIYKNTVSYFLRLYDGAPDGQGFFGQSLQLLNQGKISSVSAVDNSARYTGWKDLQNTVSTIIKQETGSLGRASFNLMDSDPITNPDHSDHIYTTLLMNTLLGGWPCVDTRYFLTYDKSWMPLNMSTDDLENQAAVFGVMESGKGDGGFPGTWEPFHKSWLGKNYSRSIPATSAAPCIAL